MSEQPEFSYVVRLDEIGRIGWPVTISAGQGERAALARRFGFAELNRLEAEITLDRKGAAISAEGTLRADLAQLCVATGDPVTEHVEEPFSIIFLPEHMQQEAREEEEIELDAEECDTLFYSEGRIDMGEAVAETLALAVNPYPRSPGADAYLREAGVLTEEQTGPFAALAALKKGGKGR